jgi:ADP-ribosylglycohydrolase
MGGLMGLIIGDALGVPVEFTSREERNSDPVRGLRAYGTHGQPAGTWSDDGSMALAHAAAFIDHGWQAERHLDAFLDWHDKGLYAAHGRVFDVGFATARALTRYRQGRPVDQAGGQHARDNGNGSLMRILPAACWWAGAPAELIIACMGEVSALTHAHARSRLICALHALLVDGLLSRKSVTASLLGAAEQLAPHIPAQERAYFRPLFDASWLDRPRTAIPSDGHVVSTLIASCWCLHRHDDFADAVLEAVNLGGDTDTTAAVTGGLAGLRAGFSGIPKAWTTVLPRPAPLIALIEKFALACREHARSHGWS